jgi:hypothetical protein
MIEGAGVYTVSADGGTPEPVPSLVPPPGNAYVLPRSLADGKSFLLGTFPDDSLHVVALDGSGARKVADGFGRQARPSGGSLLFVENAQLFARAFDPRTAALVAAQTRLADRVRSFSVSGDGTIVIRSSENLSTRLTWFSRAGLRSSTVADWDEHGGMALSADGRRVAVWKTTADRDVWEVDLSTEVTSRMTTDPGVDTDAVWSPDGTRLAFTSTRTGGQAVYVKNVSSGREDLTASLPDGGRLVVDGWTPDGRSLVVRQPGQPGFSTVTVGVDRAPRRLMKSPYVVDESHVSPDGRWIAYNSDESGAWEVYVARFPDFTARRRVSNAGGVEPHWRADGKELFYLAQDSSMMSVPISTGDELVIQKPVRLFETNIDPNPQLNQYGVTPDGQRFLGLDRVTRRNNTLTVLLNWLTPENLARH